jgi:hypothetical protein
VTLAAISARLRTLLDLSFRQREINMIPTERSTRAERARSARPSHGNVVPHADSLVRLVSITASERRSTGGGLVRRSALCKPPHHRCEVRWKDRVGGLLEFLARPPPCLLHGRSFVIAHRVQFRDILIQRAT